MGLRTCGPALCGACDPADRITKVTTASLDPAAQSDEFDAFLCKIQPEPEMRAFLARSLGSALLGRVREHALLIWFGTGANGKGTLRDAVAYALGDYGIEVPSDLLLISKWDGAVRRGPDADAAPGWRSAPRSPRARSSTSRP